MCVDAVYTHVRVCGDVCADVARTHVRGCGDVCVDVAYVSVCVDVVYTRWYGVHMCEDVAMCEMTFSH